MDEAERSTAERRVALGRISLFASLPAGAPWALPCGLMHAHWTQCPQPSSAPWSWIQQSSALLLWSSPQTCAAAEHHTQYCWLGVNTPALPSISQAAGRAQMDPIWALHG